MSGVPGYREVPNLTWEGTADTDIDEAAAFLRMFFREHPEMGSIAIRLAEVTAEVAATGTYRHTPDELTFGARVAWRNASRCIGRLYWNSLLVRDCRESTSVEQVFRDVVDHLHVAGGRTPAPGALRHLRPTISVFAPAAPGQPHARIWNEQLIRYAGYQQVDGSVIGDPRYVDFTVAMTARGWIGKGDAFDVLPIAIETPGDSVCLFELPESAVLEVPIGHPEYPWFADFGLRWHAVPAISNMRLTIGGVHYPMAPFNGWYMGAEIGARNLADADRYNMLPIVASRLGLDTSRESSLWRDRALVELNIAVLRSFERAGIQISDHHTESARFVTHIAREERAGRVTPADWTWIVPPISGGSTPVFHRYYDEADLRPAFYLDAAARDLGRHGKINSVSTGAPQANHCPAAHRGGEPDLGQVKERPATGGSQPVRTVTDWAPRIRPAAPRSATGPIGDWFD